MELNPYLTPRPHLGRRGYVAAGNCIGDHRVPAPQHGAWRGRLHAVRRQFQPVAQGPGALGRGRAEHRARFVDTLLHGVQCQPQAAFQAVGAEPLQQGAMALRARFQRGAEVGPQRRHPALQLVARCGHHLRGGGGGRGAMICGVVAQGAVDFVADRRDHGGGGGRDGAHHPFIRERQQILQRPAAAGDDDHVAEPPAVGGAHAAGDARGGVGTLHRRRQDHHVDPGIAAPQHAQQVTHRRTGGGGDHGHPARQQRQRTLARVVEQPFRGKGALALLEHGQQVACPGALNALRNEPGSCRGVRTRKRRRAPRTSMPSAGTKVRR